MRIEAEPAPLAIVIRDSDRPSVLVTGATGSEVRQLTVAEAVQLSPWPTKPLVMLACAPPRGKRLARFTELAARGRNPAWLVLAKGRQLRERRRAWGEVVSGAVSAPIHVDTLRLLVRNQREIATLKRDGRTARRDERSVSRRLTLLSGTLRAASSLLDPGMVSRFIMQRAAVLVRSAWWRLYRLDENRGALRLDARVDPPGIAPPAEWIPVDRGIAGEVARTRETICIRNPLAEPRIDRELEWPGKLPSTLLATPLVSRGRVIGVTEIADPRAGRFTRRDIDLVRTLMEPAAIALDNAQLFRKLEERTVTDDLTQLYNARFMENYLRREAKRAVRYGHHVSLLFIDLDGFKQVNDVHGHMAGSRTLAEVGEVLRENVREIDVVARWGGDEFAIVLPDTGVEGAQNMAERIRNRIASTEYLTEYGLEVRVSASIGVAAHPEHGTTAEALLAAADAAMYRVKHGGKNGVQLAEKAEEPMPMLV